MREDELKAILNAEITASIGYLDDELSQQRRKAMDYYLGEPYGNEVEGRSKVVTTEVADTIEWIMPSLLRIFTASDRAVLFEPVGPEDEAGAKQETDYLNHVFYKENNGFLILYQWFKDALLQKNGVVKHYWRESEETEQESYQGLTDQEFNALVAEEDVEPVEHREYQTTVLIGDQALPMTAHDIKLQRRVSRGRATAEPVPPEEFLISRRAKSIQQARFIGHRLKRTRQELVDLGYDRNLVERLPSEDGDLVLEERIARFKHEQPFTDDSLDPWQQSVWMIECYYRVDFDGDGSAELRKITMAGHGAYELLDNEPIDAIPFSAITPIIMPHRFVGLSVADLVMDLQLIKSTVLRQILDNLYLVNNERKVVVENMVNLDDLLESRPGGIIRAKALNMIQSLETTPFTGHAFGMLEYLDTVRENRTGVTRYNQGLDANTLNKTAHGIQSIMNAAQQRIELIARVFAETGVKDMFLALHALLQKHQKVSKLIRLRNQWVPVDPSEWRKRYNMTVHVGLGTGDQTALLQHLLAIYQIQKELLPLGLVKPENLYATAAAIVEAGGKKMPEVYFTPPESNELPPPPPDPAAQAQMAKVQVDQQKLQLDGQKLQLEGQRLQLDAQAESANQARAEAEVAVKHADVQAGREIASQARAMDQMRLAQQAQEAAANQALERYKIETERDLKLREQEIERLRAEVQQQTQLLVKQMEIEADPERMRAATEASKVESSRAITSALDALAAKLDLPRKVAIEYDADGLARAVNGRPIKRNERGQIAGVE